MKEGVVRFAKGNARVLVMLAIAAVMAVASAGDPPDPDAWILTSEDFSGLATQILTYLGYAVGAGVTLLAAVIGARRAWSFMRRFL